MYKGPPLEVNVEKVIVLAAVIVPMLTRFPDESILLVPALAPVLIPVVPFRVVPVMVFPVAIVPNPEAIEPEASAPTVVKLDVVTPVPRVVAFKTDVPLIRYAFPVDRDKSPVLVTLPEPLIGESVMFPVVSPPRVRV